MGSLSVWHWIIVLALFGGIGIAIRQAFSNGKSGSAVSNDAINAEASLKPTVGISFFDAIRFATKRTFQYKGRASRSEFWWFYLFTTMVFLPLNIVLTMYENVEPETGTEIATLLIVSLAAVVFGIYTLLSGVSLGVRRLHDVDFRGWWLLLGVIPLAGAILLLVMFTRPGSAGENRFG
jgi:uncharacterized membrane protein YhaH (DUF805 family)